ncbi:MAG: GGDEF domain-containing protein [Treponema sp.]|nr:GGDEF domain-containing protein [Treponema sp.]
MENIEVKILYLDKDLNIIDRNKEFYSYFEKVGFMYNRPEDIVSANQKNEFLNFLQQSTNFSDFHAFNVKKIDGNYFQNIVYKKEAFLNNKKCLSLRFIDLSRAFSFFNESKLYEKRVSYALSLTSEYLFMYRKSTNNFTLHSFMQNKRTIVYDEDIDSWKNKIIEDGLIDKNESLEFESKINEFKACEPSFTMTVTSSLRFSHSMFERLVFKASRMEFDDDIYMIGRMLPEALVEQSDKSTELLQTLKLDALTGVYNKKAITDYAEKRFTKGTKENAVLAIVDLDHFKPVNDAYGHLSGDKVLKKAGDILRQIIGESGVIGRYGGDEFLLIIEDMDETKFRGIFRSINTDIRSAFQDMFTDIQVTASIGSAIYPLNGDSFDELFKKADFCLYRAKDKGRDRYVFFRDDLHGELYKKASESKTEGIKYDVREVKELKSMADFLLNLGAQSRPAINTVLDHMLKTYNLDSINIYYGEAMERIFSLGKKPEELREASYAFTNDFYQALSGRPFIKVNFTTELNETEKPFGNILDQRGIKSSIHCILGTPERILGLITFDRLKEAAMWAEYETNCCIMVGAALNLLPEAKLRLLFI